MPRVTKTLTDQQINAHFGANLRRLRKQRNLTIDQLAEQLSAQCGQHVSRSTIGAWERGTRAASAAQLWHVCQFFECSAYAITAGTMDTNDDPHLRFYREIGALPPHSRKILYYCLAQWGGNVVPLIELMGAFASLTRADRAEIHNAAMFVYNRCRAAGELVDGHPEIDAAFLESEGEKLLHPNEVGAP